MIVVNMWFIKHTNGLFHYGLDYTAELGADVREVWVRNAALAQAVGEKLPNARVLILTARELFARLLRVRRCGDLLFTPSSHPLALLRRQVIVVHDTYPFKGHVGAIKLALFQTGLALSGGVAAYINHADGRRFLERCGLADARMRYLPNRVAALHLDPSAEALTVGQQLIVGLFGSDSPKKNYDALFSALDASIKVPVIWRIYGHTNAYTDRLRADYPEVAIEVVGSDEMKMHQFINSIDLAVSVALGEGFARPIALALMQGVPTLLLDTPVFREFYANSAQLFTTPEALVVALAALRPGDRLERPRLVNKSELQTDFDGAVAWLRAH
jgi:glycosyltransferase involved in cell wall biosynthesis